MASSNDQSQSVSEDAISSTELDSQVALLQELVSAELEEDQSPGNFALLLRQLELADDVAKGVEGQLDKLLGNLTEMLQSLENDNETQAEPGKEKSTSIPPEPAEHGTETKESD